MTPRALPTHVVARAPVRVADVGGWTDTWFWSPRPGRVCHVAVGPGIEVEVTSHQVGAGGGLTVDLAALGGRRHLVLGDHAPGEDLLVHALAAGLAACTDVHLDVEIRSAVPPGASLGTSGAVLVALLGALDAVTGGHRTRADVARWAHEVETGPAGREAGVQDQWAAAMGGCEVLDIGPYPEVVQHPVPLGLDVERNLAQQLVTVVFGAHDSSAMHQQVIASLTALSGGVGPDGVAALDRLAGLAGDAAAAIWEGDLGGWAAILTEATVTQAVLHADLVGPAHRAGITIARTHGALGWKVNGAGGAGGSLTIVAPDGDSAAVMRTALLAHDPSWVVPDLAPSAGLTIERPPD